MYLNRAIIIGNLTRDPELKSLPSGMQVTSFSVATNRVWKDKNGARQESTDYHNVVVFGRQASTAAQYLRKGSGVLVEGRLQTRSWDGPDGKKNYRTEIVADRVQFGNRPSSGGASAPADKPGDDNQDNTPPIDTIEYPADDINIDDIPF